MQKLYEVCGARMWTAWDTYYLKIATTHFAVCCADIEHRQIGVVDETEVGGVPGFPVLESLRLDRPLKIPSN